MSWISRRTRSLVVSYRYWAVPVISIRVSAIVRWSYYTTTVARLFMHRPHGYQTSHKKTHSRFTLWCVFCSLVRIFLPSPCRVTSDEGTGETAWASSQYKDRIYPGMGIPMLKIRRLWDRLIFDKGIPILVRSYHYIETGPWCFCLIRW